MPERIQPLAPSTIINARSKEAVYVLRDGYGLLLVVQPIIPCKPGSDDKPLQGSKLWRFDYRSPDTGKRNTLSRPSSATPAHAPGN
ncbi:MAG: hypothetical protein JSR26_08415 [Proteobacteria bacterium]|nr:hypothetical protein [Pseudomonadota bacterium]